MKLSLASLVLSAGWLIPWLFAFGTGQVWWVPPVSALALLGLASRRRRQLLAPLLGAGLMLAGFVAGGVLAAVAAGLAAAAGWTSYAPEPRTGLAARFLLALVALGTLVMWQPHWWPTLPVLLAVGAAGLAEAERPAGVHSRHWWGLAAAVIVAALGVTVIVFTLSPRMTPGPTITIPILPPHYYPRKPGGGGGAPHALAPPPNLTLLWIALGLGLLAGAALWVRRMIRDWNPEAEPTEGEISAAITERRPAEPNAGAGAAPLTPTRRYVWRQLRHARRGRARSHPYETVREWAARVFTQPADDGIRGYEEVRYGGMPDSAERASWVARHWPSRRRRERAAAERPREASPPQRPRTVAPMANRPRPVVRRRRPWTLWAGLVLVGITSGAVAGLATRQHTYTVQQLTAHWKAPYDLVVFPKGGVPPASSLVDPNSLDTGTGGITLAQYHVIQHLSGVAVAAPLAPLGSISVPLAAIAVPPPASEPDGLYRIAVEQRNQGLPAGEPLVGYYRYNGFNQAPNAGLEGVMTLYFMAVNPTAESRLMGLRQAIVAGHYFTAADHRPHVIVQTLAGTDETSRLYVFPVILTDVSPEAGRQVVTVTHLQVPSRLQMRLGDLIATAPYYGLGGPLGALSGTVTSRASFSYPALWQDYVAGVFLGKVARRINGYPVQIRPSLTEGHNVFELGGALTLAQTPSPFPKRWPVALIAEPDRLLGRTGSDVLGEPFRSERTSRPWNLDITPIGLYNPARLHVSDDPLTHLPLVAYRPETGTEVISTAGKALNPPLEILPDGSPIGLWTAPPEALTPIAAVRPLLGRAPISSIRIKVSGVRPLGAGGEARLRAVASEITRVTGLPVVIMRGASPEQILLHPGQLPGFTPMGWIATDWVRLGTSVEILHQVSLSQVVMLGPVLMAAALFAGISAWTGLAGDRRRWAVALAVGVPPRVVWRQLIRYAGIQGLGVAALAIVAATAIGRGPALVLAAPVALAAALVVAGAMVPGARMAAQQDPVRGLKPEPPAGMARIRVGTGTQLGWALAAAAWRRLLLAVGALVVPAAVVYAVGLVEVAWHSTLHLTVLGQYLLVHGGWVMTAASLVTAALTAVAAGEIASAGAAWRRGTWAVGAALGWPRRVPAAAMAWEAGIVGLLAGAMGTGLAAAVLSPLFGVPVARGLALATALGVILMSELAAWPAVWRVGRQDPVAVLKS